jgi:hypothetical protein
MDQFHAVISLTKLRKPSNQSAEGFYPDNRTILSGGLSARRLTVHATCGAVLVALSMLFVGAPQTWAQQSSDVAQQQQNTTQDPSLVAAQTQSATQGPPDPKQEQNQTEGSPDIAKTAQNPIAHVISVPLENDFYPQTGINKEDEYVLQMKPVVPIRLSRDWNLITRTVIPIIQTPELAPGINGNSGLGDIQESLFFSPTKAGPGGIIWGAGPVISAPTATQNIYGTKKLSLGPTVVVLKIQGHWLYGALTQNYWSVAGPRARPDVNQFLTQPFVNYNLPHKWYVVSSPVITANWKVDTERWVVPVGGGVGKIVHFGKVPVNIYSQFFGNAEHPNGTSKWSARFQMQFLFPKKG